MTTFLIGVLYNIVDFVQYAFSVIDFSFISSRGKTNRGEIDMQQRKCENGISI